VPDRRHGMRDELGVHEEVRRPGQWDHVLGVLLRYPPGRSAVDDRASGDVRVHCGIVVDARLAEEADAVLGPQVLSPQAGG